MENLSKEEAFRKYLVDSGMLDMTVKFFIALSHGQNTHLSGETLVKGYYGTSRHPLWDVIDDLRASSSDLTKTKDSLESELLTVTTELNRLTRIKVSVDFWRLIDTAKSKQDVNKKTIIAVLNSSDAKAKVSPAVQAAVPDAVNFTKLTTWLMSDQRASDIAGSWLSKPYPWSNQASDDFIWFWATYKALA